jgi:uncharacterized protein YdaU (DUF1376 family)
VSVSTERSEGSPLAFLKFYGSDFLNATAAWTMEERGIYITLLWYAWVNGGLPAEIDRIDRMAPGAKACWPLLESKFPIGTDGLRRNPRQERDRATMRAKSESAAKRGRRGAEQRWSSHGNSHQLATDQPSNPDGYGMASQSSEFRGQSSDPESESENKHLLNGDAVERDSVSGNTETGRRKRWQPSEADFEEFYRRYPRRVGRGAARKAYMKAVAVLVQHLDIIEEYGPEYMLNALDRYTSDPRTKALEPQFIPHPATWLNSHRFIDALEDEPTGDIR